MNCPFCGKVVGTEFVIDERCSCDECQAGRVLQKREEWRCIFRFFINALFFCAVGSIITFCLMLVLSC